MTPATQLAGTVGLGAPGRVARLAWGAAQGLGVPVAGRSLPCCS